MPLVTPQKKFCFTVDKGKYNATGNWKMTRIRNGGQSSYGLNLKADESVLLKGR